MRNSPPGKFTKPRQISNRAPALHRRERGEGQTTIDDKVSLSATKDEGRKEGRRRVPERTNGQCQWRKRRSRFQGIYFKARFAEGGRKEERQ